MLISKAPARQPICHPMLSVGVSRPSLWVVIAIGLTLSCLITESVLCDHGPSGVDEEDAIDLNDLKLAPDDSQPAVETLASNDAKGEIYTSPKISAEGLYLYEHFDDEDQFKANWVQSGDSKYNGKWKLSSGADRPEADLQMVMPEKARHYGISSKLTKPFEFSSDKPLVVQYEVQFREGLDCGGAYVKLLRNSAISDLTKLTDKTPFTIMFGPDKCGSESKLHFIVQYLNPKTQEYGERHWKQAKYVLDLMGAFSDKKHHLFKLVLKASNKFELFLDDKSVGTGDLLDDMDPPINPPKEIVDPNDKKPEDWDERAQIDDPDAKKPEDWDENAPKTIEDADAMKPDDWLEDEPKYIADPSAKQPDDWEEMDGEWEAPKIENPACAKASGCGKWTAPQVANPAYKGKWKAPKIENPNYKGKWAPRNIPNPDYYFDEKPFASLDPIGSIAFELWSMADNIAFDNLLITNNVGLATEVQSLTWQTKKAAADASSPSLMTRASHYLTVHPWLWGVLALAVALPLWLFISYCCETKRGARGESAQEAARRKKTDEPRADDVDSREKDNDDEDDEGETIAEDDEDEDEDEDEDDKEATGDDDSEDDKKGAGDSTPSKRSVRQRKVKSNK